MTEWERDELELRARHGWRAQSGCKIFVVDRGAVRFDYPQDWVVSPDDDSVTLHDKEPPDANSRLAVSYVRLPPVDWSGLPLAALVETGMRGYEQAIDTWGLMREARRGDLEAGVARGVLPRPGREGRSQVADVHCKAIDASMFDYVRFLGGGSGTMRGSVGDRVGDARTWRIHFGRHAGAGGFLKRNAPRLRAPRSQTVVAPFLLEEAARGCEPALSRVADGGVP